MGGIQGLGGVNGPSPERPAELRDKKREEVRSIQPPSDGVQISDDAQEAASVAKLIGAASDQTQVRQQKIEEAQLALNRGDYKLPNVMAEVAKRISRYL